MNQLKVIATSRLNGIFALLFSLLICPRDIAAQSNPDIWDELLPKIESTITHRMAAKNITGLSLAVFSTDTMVYSRGFGYADKRQAKTATDSTIYLSGSITKLFTSALVLQQADSGNLHIHNSVSDYLPAFTPSMPGDSSVRVSIQSVLTHQSGLPSDMLSGIILRKAPQKIDVAEKLSRTYLVYPPGYIYSYSNVAYSLLGQMLESVTGMPYEHLLDASLFGPLQMDHSFIEPNTAQRKLISKAYDENGHEAEELLFRDVPAGGAYSNVLDLAAFGQMMLREGALDGQRIMEASTARECLRIQNKQVRVRAGKHMGYGWMIDYGNNAGKIAWHNGANIHFRSMFAIAPELGIGIVYLANSDNGGDLADDVFHWLDEAGRKLGHRTTFFPPHAPAFIPHRFTRIRPADSLLDAVAGHYSRSGLIYEVERKGKKLVTHIRDQRMELLPLEDGLFIPQGRIWGIFPSKAKDMRIDFQRIDSFTIAQQVRANGHRELFGTRLTHYPISDQWQSRTGHYEVLNKQADEKVMLQDVHIVKESGFLMLKGRELFRGNHVEYAIQPVDDHLGKLMGLGRGTGDYLHFNHHDGREILWFLGHEFAKTE